MLDAQSEQAVLIRRAVVDDAAGIAEVYRESAEHHATIDPERYIVPLTAETAAQYREGRQHPERPPENVVTLVAVSAGRVIGFVDARIEHPFDAMHRKTVYCYIAEIAVAAMHRSRGVGAMLLRAAEDWGRARGAEFASLEYNAANPRAAEFYRQRMGYRAASITVIKRLDEKQRDAM